MKRLLIISLITALLFMTVGCNKPNQEQSQTSGETLYQVFNKAIDENPDLSAEELANIIIKNDIIKFQSMVAPITEGWLMGFKADTIEGFKEGALFGPEISTIPFIGYIFILEEGADVVDFINNLKSSADLNWNICTSAEEITVGNVGQVVFFVMCNKDINAE